MRVRAVQRRGEPLRAGRIEELGGGIERMINRHWSIKAEYLYYKLDDQHFSGVFGGTRFGFNAETEGNIIRAGLNYKF